MKKKRAIFPGTFDPFTTGHFALIERALKIVDEVVISIGTNDSKSTFFHLDDRLAMVKQLYRNNPAVSVCGYNNLTVEFAKQIEADFIIRGIRSVNDFEYEKNIADVNRMLTGIETIILFTEPQYAHISSSIVRELFRFGHDVLQFVPSEIADYIKQPD